MSWPSEWEMMVEPIWVEYREVYVTNWGCVMKNKEMGCIEFPAGILVWHSRRLHANDITISLRSFTSSLPLTASHSFSGLSPSSSLPALPFASRTSSEEHSWKKLTDVFLKTKKTEWQCSINCEDVANSIPWHLLLLAIFNTTASLTTRK